MRFFLQICAIFLYFFTAFVSQSRAVGQGQRKGKNVPIGDAPPPISSGSASVPQLQVGLQQQRQMLREDNNLKITNIPSGNVTREQGLGNKMKGGGNVAWK